MIQVAQFSKVSFAEFSRQMDNLYDISPDEMIHIYDNIKLPQRATNGSAGYDFFIPFPIDLSDGEEAIVPTGIRCKIMTGNVLMICPKSGLGCKNGMHLKNTVGIIDSDYYGADNEGHILVNFKIDKAHYFNAGDKFVQGIFLPFCIAENDTASRDIRRGGFGSTGK